jgi:lysophospholipid acyltransferase (LPLAT)-like uncharacterized protein
MSRTRSQASPGLIRVALGWALGLVLRAWLSSLKLTVVVDERTAALRRTRPIVLVFWHGQQIPLLRWARGQHMVALVSLSQDGELQARALPRLGIAVERGSSSRGGARGLRRIVRRLRAGFAAAFAVDGPRGPSRVVRTAQSAPHAIGAVVAARLAGGVIVAMASGCSSAWVAADSWDRFELPRPGSRVVVVLGPPIEPCDASARALSAAIDEACSRAAELAAAVPECTAIASLHRGRLE